jgi:hypothetical protein
MKLRPSVLTSNLLALLLVFSLEGCARTKVKKTLDDSMLVIPRPTWILVHKFTAPARAVSLDPSPGKKLARNNKRQSDLDAQEEIAEAMAEVTADRLVRKLKKLGLRALRVEQGESASSLGSALEIQGDFLSIEEGRRMRRMLLGFGTGSAKLKAKVDVHSLFGGRSQLVQQFTVIAKSGRKPGAAVTVGAGGAAGQAAAAAVASTVTSIASEKLSGELNTLAKKSADGMVKQLKKLFERQGWI